MVLSWWKAAGEIAPNEGMLPLESTFIAILDGQPAAAMTIYLTNTFEVAYVENFIGNPELKGTSRKEAALQLTYHIANFARSRGYKRLVGMTCKDALKKRYQELGGVPTLDGVMMLVWTM